MKGRDLINNPSGDAHVDALLQAWRAHSREGQVGRPHGSPSGGGEAQEGQRGSHSPWYSVGGWFQLLLLLLSQLLLPFLHLLLFPLIRLVIRSLLTPQADTFSALLKRGAFAAMSRFL